MPDSTGKAGTPRRRPASLVLGPLYARLVQCLGDQILAWLVDTVAPGGRVTQAEGLREGGNPWLVRLERAGVVRRVVVKTEDSASAQDRRQLRTQVAALTLAGNRGLPVPRVVAADLTGAQAGMVAAVTSVLPGSSAIPRRLDAERAERVGAVAAQIHAVALEPQPDLPLRTRPLAGMDFVAWRRSAGTTPLLTQAEQRISEMPVPGGATVLVHGDLWQGNMLWSAASALASSTGTLRAPGCRASIWARCGWTQRCISARTLPAGSFEDGVRQRARSRRTSPTGMWSPR